MKTTASLCLVLALSGSSIAFARMDMKGMAAPEENTRSGVHKATAVVKSVDAGKGKVTLAHGAISSLNWPPMTMAFSVKDKRLFDKLVVGRKVEVALVKEGAGFTVTAVK